MINRQNWIDTNDFLAYQENTMQNDPQTINRLRVGLRPLLEWADSRLFGEAKNIVPSFPAYLASTKAEGTGEVFLVQTRAKTLQIARQFLTYANAEWPSRYKEIKPNWIKTIQPARRNAEHTTIKEHLHYTPEDVLKIAALTPENLREKRDIAGVCFLFLSGMRAGAFCSIPIECVDIVGNNIYQLPEKGVRTKNRKAAITYMLDIPEIFEVVSEWDRLVRKELSKTDMWYPVLNRAGDKFEPGRKYTEQRSKNFDDSLQVLCYRAGIPYLSLHKLRHGHAVYGLRNSTSMEDFQTISRNLMHANMSITDGIYGGISADDQRKAMNRLGKNKPVPQVSQEDVKLSVLADLFNNPEKLKLLQQLISN